MALVIKMDKLETKSDDVLNELVLFALEGQSLNIDGVFLSALMMAQKAETDADNKEVVTDLSGLADLLFKDGEKSKKAFDLVLQFSKALSALKETTDDISDTICIVTTDPEQETGFELLLK